MTLSRLLKCEQSGTPDDYDLLVDQLKNFWSHKGRDPHVIRLGWRKLKKIGNAINVSPDGGMWFREIPVELHSKPNKIEMI